MFLKVEIFVDVDNPDDYVVIPSAEVVGKTRICRFWNLRRNAAPNAVIVVFKTRASCPFLFLVSLAFIPSGTTLNVVVHTVIVAVFPPPMSPPHSLFTRVYVVHTSTSAPGWIKFGGKKTIPASLFQFPPEVWTTISTF